MVDQSLPVGFNRTLIGISDSSKTGYAPKLEFKMSPFVEETNYWIGDTNCSFLACRAKGH